MQALSFVLEEARQFSSDKGNFYDYEDNFNLYWNCAKGTTAIDEGAVDYFQACLHVYTVFSVLKTKNERNLKNFRIVTSFIEQGKKQSYFRSDKKIIQ